MNNNFAFNLKHIRQEKGLTQEQLGKLMNKDYSTIGKWENGTRSPIMEDVLKLSDILNVDIKDLIDKDYNKEPNKTFDKLDILYSKSKDIMSEETKATLEFLMQKTIENYEKSKNNTME